MTDIRRLHSNARMSQTVVHAGTVYLAGQIAQDTAGKSVTEQTTEILANIDKLLAEVGSDKSKILTAYLYVVDIAGTFGEVNAVWEKWVSPGNQPARTTIEANLAGPQYGIEIGVIAAQ